MLVLLTMVAVAVMIFIKSGITIGRYKYIREGDFSLTPAQMSSMENMLKEFEPGFGRRIAVGVGMCIFSPFPLITTSVIGASAVIVLLMVPVLLMMVAVAVHEFVRLGVIREGYLQLMKKEDFDPVNKQNAQHEDKVGGVYWPLVVAIYLLWSFMGDAWDRSWIIFPIAGLIFAAIKNFFHKTS